MRSNIAHIAGLIALSIGSRLLPHPPNMTAIGAVSLKSRERFGPRGLLIPIVGMLVADAIIGFYEWRLLLSVYASLLLFGMLGGTLRRNGSAGAIIGASALGSTLFFFITNTFVWALSYWYPHTPAGLLACLSAGLPFFISMAIGDLAFSLALFKGRGVYRATVGFRRRAFSV